MNSSVLLIVLILNQCLDQISLHILELVPMTSCKPCIHNWFGDVMLRIKLVCISSIAKFNKMAIYSWQINEMKRLSVKWCSGYYICCVVAGWPAVLEFLELFLDCKWFLKNPSNSEFLRICSWNVLEFYFSSFIKNSTHLFHDSFIHLAKFSSFGINVSKFSKLPFLKWLFCP